MENRKIVQYCAVSTWRRGASPKGEAIPESASKKIGKLKPVVHQVLHKALWTYFSPEEYII